MLKRTVHLLAHYISVNIALMNRHGT